MTNKFERVFPVDKRQRSILSSTKHSIRVVIEQALHISVRGQFFEFLQHRCYAAEIFRLSHILKTGDLTIFFTKDDRFLPDGRNFPDNPYYVESGRIVGRAFTA